MLLSGQLFWSSSVNNAGDIGDIGWLRKLPAAKLICSSPIKTALIALELELEQVIKTLRYASCLSDVPEDITETRRHLTTIFQYFDLCQSSMSNSDISSTMQGMIVPGDSTKTRLWNIWHATRTSKSMFPDPTSCIFVSNCISERFSYGNACNSFTQQALAKESRWDSEITTLTAMQLREAMQDILSAPAKGLLWSFPEGFGPLWHRIRKLRRFYYLSRSYMCLHRYSRVDVRVKFKYPLLKSLSAGLVGRLHQDFTAEDLMLYKHGTYVLAVSY